MNKFKRNKQVSVCGKLPTSGVIPRFKLWLNWQYSASGRNAKRTQIDHIFFDSFDNLKPGRNNIIAISKSHIPEVKTRHTSTASVSVISLGYMVDFVYRMVVSISDFNKNLDALPSRQRGNPAVNNTLLWMLLDMIEHSKESPCDIIECKFSEKDWETCVERHYYYNDHSCSWSEDDFAALSTSFERNTFRGRMNSLYKTNLDNDCVKNINQSTSFYKTTMKIPPEVAMREVMRVRGRCL